MKDLTFGFMDPERNADLNAELFVQWRAIAIRSFHAQRTCNLDTFAADSIPESDEILRRDTGPSIDALRNQFYASLSERDVPIRLPDIQSFFLYAFTLGVNRFSLFLMDQETVPDPHPVRTSDILGRHFPILGPEWLCDAVNSEMPFLEDAFCDFQDGVLGPIGKAPSIDHSLLADAIAGSFLWANLGGTFWLRDAVTEVCQAVNVVSGALNGTGTASYRVRKSLQLLNKDDVERAMALGRIFDHTNEEADRATF